jgi:hypothetical protein
MRKDHQLRKGAPTTRECALKLCRLFITDGEYAIQTQLPLPNHGVIGSAG